MSAVIRPRTKLLLAAVGGGRPSPSRRWPRNRSCPPGFDEPAPAPSPSAIASANARQPQARSPREGSAVVETGAGRTDGAGSRRDDRRAGRRRSSFPTAPGATRRSVGPLPAAQTGFGEAPWGRSSGKFLSVLMRRTDAPLASRWGHILLRNALLTKAARAERRPSGRLGRRARLAAAADGRGRRRADCWSRASTSTDFTPKLFQVAAQSALANADPSGLCPLEDGLRRVERGIAPLTRRDVRLAVGQQRSRGGGHRGGAAARPVRRDRPGAGRQGGRRGRRHRARGDDRMGPGPNRSTPGASGLPPRPG